MLLVRPCIMKHKPLFLCVFLLAWTPGVPASPDTEALANPQFHALLALGSHYRYGGRAPDTGFDCSGLVAHAFQRAWGILLPHNSRAQSAAGAPVGMAEIEPGDLVFYNTRNRPYSHVGIYLGDGRFIHAPRPGERVRIESVASPYWRARFNGARRLAPPDDRHSH